MDVQTVYPLYYRVLGIAPGADREAVKRAYRQVAKRNHPDLFPESERTQRLVRMANINEAYRMVLAHASAVAESGNHVPDTGPKASAPPKSEPVHVSRSEAVPADALAPLRDPAYVYYKRGCVLFSQGRKALLQRYNGRRLDFTNLSGNVLKLAVHSLGYFHKAHECFRRVVEDYPHSIWVRDSDVKLYFLSRYDAIYRRICENMKNQLLKEPHRS